jgi:hypothetical protein
MASIIIDQPNLPLVEFGGGSWTNLTGDEFFGGSSSVPSFSTGSQTPTDKWGWLCFRFTGNVLPSTDILIAL